MIDDIFYKINPTSDFLKTAKNFPIEYSEEIKKFNAWKIFSDITKFSINKLDNDIFELVKTKEIFENKLKRKIILTKNIFQSMRNCKK